MSVPRGVGVFGGTFDPVHCGHVTSIIELRDRLGLDRVLVVPAGVPPHRATPLSSGADRLAMLHRALDGEARVEIDEREMNRSGRSFMVDTLASVRAEIGQQEPLIFALGMDAYLTLPTWHQWEALGRYAHIVALARPGASPELTPELARWEAAHRVQVEHLLDKPAGSVARVELSQVEVSATAVRGARRAGHEWREWVPAGVAAYIEEHTLYVESARQQLGPQGRGLKAGQGT